MRPREKDMTPPKYLVNRVNLSKYESHCILSEIQLCLAAKPDFHISFLLPFVTADLWVREGDEEEDEEERERERARPTSSREEDRRRRRPECRLISAGHLLSRCRPRRRRILTSYRRRQPRPSCRDQRQRPSLPSCQFHEFTRKIFFETCHRCGGTFQRNRIWLRSLSILC